MNKFVQDLFMTKQPDGSFHYDITNPAYSFFPVMSGFFTYIGMGVVSFHQSTAALPFDLRAWAVGAAAYISGGMVAVLAHSKSIN